MDLRSDLILSTSIYPPDYRTGDRLAYGLARRLRPQEVMGQAFLLAKATYRYLTLLGTGICTAMDLVCRLHHIHKGWCCTETEGRTVWGGELQRSRTNKTLKHHLSFPLVWSLP